MPSRDLSSAIADLEQRMGKLRAAAAKGDRDKLEAACQEVQNALEELRGPQEAVRSNQATLGSIVDAAMDAIVSMYDDERIVVFNRAAERVFRCTAAEALGQPVEKFIPERFRAKHSEKVRQFRDGVLSQPTPGGVPLKTVGRRADGEEFPMEASISATRVDGHWLCTIILQDITGRVRAERELAESRQLLEGLADASPDILFVFDVAQRADAYASKSVAKVLGYAPEQVLALGDKLIETLLHPDDLAGSPARIERISQLKDGEVYENELRVRHANGEWRWLRHRQVALTRGPNGMVTSTAGVAWVVTEEKRAHGALRQSEERFRLLAENSYDVVFRVGLGPTMAYEYISPAVTRITGYAPEEWYADPALGTKIGHPEDHPRVDAIRGKGYSGDIQYRIIHRDGSVRWIDSHLEPVYDSAGNLVAMQGVRRDITERKRTEERLGQQAAALAAAANGIVITDREGKITWVNPAFTRVTGYTADEVVGQTPRVLKSGEHDQRFYAGLWNTILAGEVWQGDMVNRRKDGSLYYEEMTVTPVKNAQGEVTQFIAIKQDVTARKMQEAEHARLAAAVDEERQRLEAVLEASPVGICVTDASGRMVLVNAEAQRMTGFARGVGDDLKSLAASIVHRRPDGRTYCPEELPLERALHTGERVFLEEIRFEFPDGRKVTNLVTATPLCSADGTLTGAISILQDMGPLEEAERRRNEFLGMVSHELRSPLTAIKGAAATALSAQPVDYGEAMQLFQIIDQQADKLRDLVKNLLDLTRIEAGALSINAVPTDLRVVVQEAVGTLARIGASQEVQVRLPDALPRVQADGRRVAQVLTNLLSNAAKFSPPTLPLVVEGEYDSSLVTVHVRDRGRGIPPDKMPLLFKKFSQVHDDSGRALSGTGLGLAICKGIVEAHGGRVWVESGGEGQGATFSFTLPVAVGTALVAPDTARRADHLGRVSRTAERTRIVSLDDDQQTLRYIRRTLNEAGYQTFATADPTQCIKLIQEQEPDLVVLDLMLPGTSGFDVLKQVREFSGVPVIFLTGSEQGENAVRALKTGADDYITKPFSPSELLARIEVVLRRRVLPHVVEVRPPFTLGDLTINFAERRVLKGGQPVSLSATEYKLLYQLAVHAGQVLTHDQLLEQVWGQEYRGEGELLRSMVRNLRRSLGDDARQPRYVLTEPQVGYRMPRP